jgi:hypothetical protein
MADWLSTITQIQLPGLKPDNSEKLSEVSGKYNCIAFAAGDVSRRWDPPIDGVLDPGQYWPKGAPEDFDLTSLIKVYELHGFSLYLGETNNGDFDVIALYAHDDEEGTHAARFNRDGYWTSKLGAREDIRHDHLSSLEGDHPAYGSVRLLMSRLNPK